MIRQTFFDATDQQAGFLVVILLTSGQRCQRPFNMFGHHGLCFRQRLLQGGYHLRAGRAVAKGYRQIAAPALIADAADWAPLGMFEELGLAPAPQRQQGWPMQAGAGAEIGLRAGICVAVPRADELAVVAAVDAVAHQGSELFRNRAVVLDGEIGDAAATIHHIGSHNGASGADVDAGDTLAALLLFHRRVDGEWQAYQQLSQKEEGTG